MPDLTIIELLQTVRQQDINLAAEGAFLGVDTPRGTLTPDLKHALQQHKRDLLKLLTAPDADFLSETPCPHCGSHERWTWLDGRALCRVCLILDLAPLTLVRQGWADER